MARSTHSGKNAKRTAVLKEYCLSCGARAQRTNTAGEASPGRFQRMRQRPAASSAPARPLACSGSRCIAPPRCNATRHEPPGKCCETQCMGAAAVTAVPRVGRCVWPRPYAGEEPAHCPRPVITWMPGEGSLVRGYAAGSTAHRSTADLALRRRSAPRRRKSRPCPRGGSPPSPPSASLRAGTKGRLRSARRA